MSFPKNFDYHSAEAKWYPFWEAQGYFHPETDDVHGDPDTQPAFCVAMPPPNVTGALHMGHALDSTLQDITTRYKRMSGFRALWIPGTDHAGIATQTVVERHLLATTGKKRQQFSREEFLGHVWAWKNAHESRIFDQIRKLGCSCDWSRYSFTLDETRCTAVKTAFKRMFDDGLIYRGDYLVNWDPVAQTALSDDEVEYEEQSSFLWKLRYRLADSDTYIVVATTRPETLLGDTAIAVSPKDHRYAELIGKKVVVPFVGRQIPIIADDAVDPAFGTGAVKVTPAHDLNDYQMGARHGLPQINIMTKDGKINDQGGRFSGLTVAEARKQIVDEMQADGLVAEITPYMHRVGVSYRSKATIEPLLSKQWFVRVEGFKDELIRAVKEKQVTILPQEFEDQYFQWIENLHDWCISRQLWWGHRIPVWTHKDDPRRTVCCIDEHHLPDEIMREPGKWAQEEDVLDTWFSSSLWPFSIMGWPEETKDLHTFFPLSLIITGHDILFFWIARMILMSKYTFQEIPFRQAYIHGLIFGKSYWRENVAGGVTYVSLEEKKRYDAGEPVPSDVYVKWEKMSKSKGNVIDPMELIAQYGCDTTRMTLCSLPNSRQIDLDLGQFQDKQRFMTKIWNGASFVLGNIGAAPALTKESLARGIDPNLFTVEDFWIFSRLQAFARDLNQNLEGLQFDRVAYDMYQFFWNEFCSTYLELSKSTLHSTSVSPEVRENKQKVLVVVLDNILRLFHPTIPFITEELFGHLKGYFSGIVAAEGADPLTKNTLRALSAPSIVKAAFPQEAVFDGIPDRDTEFTTLVELSKKISQVLGASDASHTPSTVYIQGDADDWLIRVLRQNQHFVTSFNRKATLVFIPKEAPIPAKGTTFTIGSVTVSIAVPEETMHKQVALLQKKRDALQNQISGFNVQLASESFLVRAPQKIVEDTRSKRAEFVRQLNEVVEALQKLQ